MAITFFLQSKKNPARIWVRYRKRPIHIKAGTKFYINPKWFDNGGIKKGSMYFNPLQKELDDMRDRITACLNNRKETTVLDSNWLKETINI